MDERYENYDGSIELPNLKHETFCQTYVETADRRLSVEAAGYGTTEGSMRAIASRLLKNVNIIKRVEYLRRLKIEETKKVWKRSALDVLHDIDLIKNRCLGITLDPNTLKPFKTDHKTALKCLELEGKYLGMWEGNNIEQEKQVYIEGVDELED